MYFNPWNIENLLQMAKISKIAVTMATLLFFQKNTSHLLCLGNDPSMT